MIKEGNKPTASSTEIDEVIAAWQAYTRKITDWVKLVEGVVPKPTDCGPVYELPNPIDRPNESFAIADMRDLKYSQPHYHANGEFEIYIVLTGNGQIYVGGKKSELKPGFISVTPPQTTHFVTPAHDLVIAIFNTPHFNPNNVVGVSETNASVGFYKQQFNDLVQNL